MGRWNENNAVAPKHRSSEKLHQNKLLAGGSLWHTVLCQRNYWLYWFYPLQKCVVSPDATAFNSCLRCFFSFPFLTFLLFPVFICQELKTVHTRRLPKKRRKYPKSILNPQTAKPPHHVSEANIAVIHEHKNRNKQN